MMESFAMHAQVLTLVLLGGQEFCAASNASITEQEPRASLRGGLTGLILSELDPNWWQATTSTAAGAQTTTAAVGTTTAAPGGQSSPGATPNIPACTHYMNVPGNVQADRDFWRGQEICRRQYQQPGGLDDVEPTFISITFGTVTDYFRPPPDKNVKDFICYMLQQTKLFQWSKDGETWATPTYPASGSDFGGSTAGFPATQDSADKRATLPFWGSKTNGKTGGCGYTDKSTTTCSWNMPFKVGFCGVPQKSVPVCTAITQVTRSTRPDLAYWQDKCKVVPLTASYVKMVVGYFVDYFKPPDGKTYCDMLTGGGSVIYNGDLQWSMDGETWVTPADKSQYAGHKEMGGSWKKLSNQDIRPRVNFWGKTIQNKYGTCCYSNKGVGRGGWSLPMTMYYCEPPVKPSISLDLTEMKQTETAVKNLEQELETLHSRLLQAEKTSVNAAGNVSLARQGMYKLASKFQDEADQMKEIQSIAAFSGTKLDSVQSNLIGSQTTLRGSAANLASAAAVANKSATTQDKQHQEDLNNQIFNLLDPSKDDSLVATEKKVDEIYDEASKFRNKLANDVKTVMVTKMRRQVQNFRKAIMRLGSAARANSASTLGELGDSSSLGDDLGLNDDEQ